MSLMNRRRMMGAKSEPKLPDEYQRVEWIGNPNGGAWINLPLSFYRPAKKRITIDFIASSKPTGYLKVIAGHRSGRYNTAINVSTTNNAVSVYSQEAGGLYTLNATNIVTNQLYGLKTRVIFESDREAGLSKISVKNDSGEASQQIEGYFENWPNKLFRILDATQFNGNICEVLSEDLVSGATDYHLVACYRKSDGVIGMYDFVSKTLVTNDGTGAFTKGADVF